MTPPPTDPGRQQGERLLAHRQRDLVTDEELGTEMVSRLAACRGFEAAPSLIRRLPVPALAAAVAYARQILDPTWTVVPWGLGAPPPTGEAHAQELMALKRVAQQVLDSSHDTYG
jgi:hypothetical protein